MANVELDERLARLAEALDDVTAQSRSGATEYSRSGTVFAARTTEESIELRLGSEITEAAGRTPGTSASARGEEWVRFAPREWDPHATDRLEAWFRVAWRLAQKRG